MAVLNDASKTYPLDTDRIYLDGHSSGAVFAMQRANLWVGPWRGVAVHSRHSTALRVLPAWNPVPVHAFSGDADTVFSFAGHRRTLQAPARAGHTASLTVLPDYTHWNYDVGARLAPLMWRALQRRS
ncbi:hypothetical protein ACN2XU_12560 [Primorskyibacter sp. 2E107]|uniref:hypothetical protein n=1 Tax=Primorskyibacter sp. 2E107 TaxID=3403458 RepID=UPI003AF7204E